MRLLTDEQHEWLICNAGGLFADQLTKKLNETFGTAFTTTQIRIYKKNHKIPSLYKHRVLSAVYPGEVVDFITAHYQGILSSELTEMVNKEFGTDYSVKQIRAFKKNHKLRGGVNTQFKRGHKSSLVVITPELREKISKGWFKPGHEHYEYLPIGTERINTMGYRMVKTGEDKWEYKHRVIYREHYGPIPKGYSISFRDGDKTNLDPENLVALSLQAMRWIERQNQKTNKSDDVVQIAEDVVQIKSKIKEMRKKCN